MYNASMFTLFFAGETEEILTPPDWQNLKKSLAPQVMLFWDHAKPEVLKRLNDIHRHNPYTGRQEPLRILLRLDNSDCSRDTGLLQDQLRDKIEDANITAVFAGNEWDNAFDFRWHPPSGAPADWGNQPRPGEMSPIEIVARRVLHVAEALEDMGVEIISPGFTARGYTEDDAPDPGLHTWRELMAPVMYGYDSPVTGNGVHFYDGGWWVKDPEPPELGKPITHEEVLAWGNALAGARVATSTNVSRFMQAVRFWSGFHHHLTYWDEVNTFNSGMTELEHMEACLGKSKLLIHHVNPEGYHLGERVAMLCPFVANGIPNQWPAQYLMRSAAAYEMVRLHMEEEGYRDA
jgi:hypothetical protein